METVKVKLEHSPIGCPPDQRQTVLGLGLTRLQQVRELKDSPCVRGMVAKIPHLVAIVGTGTRAPSPLKEEGKTIVAKPKSPVKKTTKKKTTVAKGKAS